MRHRVEKKDVNLHSQLCKSHTLHFCPQLAYIQPIQDIYLMLETFSSIISVFAECLLG